MKNTAKLFNLTTALTVSVIASNADLQASATAQVGAGNDASAWVLVDTVEEQTTKTQEASKGAVEKSKEENGSGDQGWDFIERHECAEELTAGNDVLQSQAPGEIFKVESSKEPKAPALIEKVALETLSEKQKSCLTHFFKTRNALVYAEVREKWCAYRDLMNKIIANLLRKKDCDVSDLNKKKDALQQCDALMSCITNETFDILMQQYASSSVNK